MVRFRRVREVVARGEVAERVVNGAPNGENQERVDPVAGGEDVGVAGGAAPAVGGEPQVEVQQQAGQPGMGAMMGMLAQILERLPGPVPAPAPEMPPRGEEPPRVMAHEAVAGQMIPSYLSVMDHMQRLGTKFFHGGAKPVEADEWRARVERNFHSIRCPDEYKVDIAVHYLEGDAHMWWRNVLARRANGVNTWEEFCEEFNLKYFPQEAMDRLETEFLELSQGTRSVREYEVEFNRLRRFAGRGLQDEAAQVRRFLRGMRLELRNRCNVRSYASVAELVERAAIIEEGMIEEAKASKPQTQGKKSFTSDSGRGGKFMGGQKRKWEGSSQSASSTQSGCFKCGDKGHKVANCPKGDSRACFHCKEVGHIRTSCPKLQQGSGSSGAPPAKRTAVTPRVYSLSVESGEGSNTKPITG